MSAPDCGDGAGVPRSGEPMLDRGTNPPANERRIALTPMPGDEQYQPVTAGNRLLETAIDRPPGGIEAMPVQIDHPVRRDGALRQSPIPAAI